jgi:hypothetical protein
LLTTLFASSPTSAAQEIVRVAISPEFEHTNGKFLYRGKEMEIPEPARDSEAQRRLWEVSEKLTHSTEQGPNYDPTGSVAMYNNRDLPEGLIRPEDDQTEK